MFRPIRLVVLSALLLTALTLSAHAQQTQPSPAPAEPQVGQPAPAFSLPDTDGQTRSLSDYKGKIVVLHFQAIQCPWDKAYQPILNRIADKFKTTEENSQNVQKVVFLGVNSNKAEQPDQIKQTQTERNIPYPVLKDRGNKIADLYQARTTPHIFVIDGDGILRYKGGIEKAPVSPAEVGKSSDQYLEPVLQALLENKTPPQTQTVSIGCSIKRE